MKASQLPFRSTVKKTNKIIASWRRAKISLMKKISYLCWSQLLWLSLNMGTPLKLWISILKESLRSAPSPPSAAYAPYERSTFRGRAKSASRSLRLRWPIWKTFMIGLAASGTARSEKKPCVGQDSRVCRFTSGFSIWNTQNSPDWKINLGQTASATQQRSFKRHARGRVSLWPLWSSSRWKGWAEAD